MIRSEQKKGRFQHSNLPKIKGNSCSSRKRSIINRRLGCRKYQALSAPAQTLTNYLERQPGEFLSDLCTILLVFISSFTYKISRIFRLDLVFLIFKIPRLLQNCRQIHCPGLINYFQYNFALFSLIFCYIHILQFVQL